MPRKQIIHFYEARMEGLTMCGLPIASIPDDEHGSDSRFVTCAKCLEKAGIKPSGRITSP
jgi:hypothetical protein